MPIARDDSQVKTSLADSTGFLFQRDRIVVLGRTQAGKTVYIARLYGELYSHSQSWLSMRARSGLAHTTFMKMCADMANGRWPDPTGDQKFIDCDLSFNGNLYRLTMLDYSGEDFTRAFVGGDINSENTRALLDHLDHACGVILLIDPQNAVDSRDPTKQADDDWGMTQAVKRIREFPGGESVPIAIVLTKCDIHKGMILALGGLKKFRDDYLLWITRTAVRYYRTFECSAVRVTHQGRTSGGSPDLTKPPLNVVEPLKWILEQLESARVRDRNAAEQERREQLITRTLAHAREAIRTEPTDASFELATKLIRQLPRDCKNDSRVRDAYDEIRAAAVEQGVRADGRNTKLWLLVIAGVLVAISIVMIIVYLVQNPSVPSR